MNGDVNCYFTNIVTMATRRAFVALRLLLIMEVLSGFCFVNFISIYRSMRGDCFSDIFVALSGTSEARREQKIFDFFNTKTMKARIAH